MSRNRSRGAVGALHPILFFAFVYGISLFLAFFICNAVYNSLQASSGTGRDELPVQQAKESRIAASDGVTAMR